MNRKKLFFTLGRPLAPLYALVMRCREFFYNKGIFSSTRLELPVISVGNLTMGGTGKTPMVMHVARSLASRGARPVIVSRGYGGRAREKVNIVSDFAAIHLPAQLAGDEPRLLAEALPGVPVLTGTVRSLVGQFAVEKFAPGAVVLDDGFQHLALARDLDIVLFNANVLLHDMVVFPGGELREPLSALRRGDLFVITGVDANNRSRVERFKEFLRKEFPSTPVFEAEYRPTELVDQAGEVSGLESWQHKPFLAFCGLAEPRSFERSLVSQGFKPVGFHVFKDHHHYNAVDAETLNGLARLNNVQALVTTEKDLVKLRDLHFDFPVFALRVNLVPEKRFDEFLADFWVCQDS